MRAVLKVQVRQAADPLHHLEVGEVHILGVEDGQCGDLSLLQRSQVVALQEEVLKEQALQNLISFQLSEAPEIDREAAGDVKSLQALHVVEHCLKRVACDQVQEPQADVLQLRELHAQGHHSLVIDLLTVGEVKFLEAFHLREGLNKDVICQALGIPDAEVLKRGVRAVAQPLQGGVRDEVVS